MIRKNFHVPQTYFLSHSVGCLPRRSKKTAEEAFLGPWKDGQNWERWEGILDDYRVRIGSFIGAQKHNICPQVNIASGLTKIIHSLPRQIGKDVILMSKSAFPSNGFVAAQAKRAGYELRFVEGDPTKIENWEAALDARVAIVHITHVLPFSSTILPAAKLCKLAKRFLALTIVDAAQSIGAVEVNVSKWDADFILGTGVKFLCAGPGASFLYASDTMLKICEPVDVGWFSHEDPFEMDIEQFRYAKDAMRFFGGSPSPQPLAMAVSALKLWAEIGAVNVQTRIQDHLTVLIEDIPDNVLISPREAASRGATLVISPENAHVLRGALKSAQILHDERRAGFRFSVHGYTSEAEIDALKTCLKSA